VAGPDLPLPGQYHPPSSPTPSPSEIALTTPQKNNAAILFSDSPDEVNTSPQTTSVLNTSPANPISASPCSPISQLKLTFSPSFPTDKKEKHKPTSGKGGGGAKKKLKKKESSSSAFSDSSPSASSTSTSVCYGIERSLQLYRSNVKQLTEYLSTLSPEKIFKSSGMLESSVIVDLLLAVSFCYGTLLSDWMKVYQWYELCSADLSLKEFNFMILLLTKEQKDEMREVLMSSQERAEEEEDGGERLARILRTYQLIQ
jgi:hypothetical protein